MKIYQCFMAIALSSFVVQSAYSSPWPTGVADRVSVNSGQRVYIPVLANDLGDNLSLTDVNTTTVALGSVQMNSSKTALYYTSRSGYSGNDSFWYAFKDNLGRTNATQVFLNVISFNNPVAEPVDNNNYSGWPQANVDTVTTTKNSAITVPVLDNDYGDRLSLTSVNSWTVKGGRASIQGDSILYTPKTSYVGQDSFWYNFVDARGRKNATQVKITVTNGADNNNGSTAFNASRIPMHVGLLRNQRFVWGESGGTKNTWTTQAAPAGSSQLNITGGVDLKDNQLITYQSTDGDYYTVAIIRSSGNTITLRNSLPAPIAQWSKVGDFYRDGSHPNINGYRSVADFALRNKDLSALNYGKHVMLGDSWFYSAGIKERLQEKLGGAQIIKSGIGGDTSAMMIDRFDAHVTSQRPDVVWLIAGTNDYYRGVSVSTYKANMKTLIEKINAIGARAMVFDSSVAPSMSGNNALTEKSHEYAQALADLFNQ